MRWATISVYLHICFIFGQNLGHLIGMWTFRTKYRYSAVGLLNVFRQNLSYITSERSLDCISYFLVICFVFLFDYFSAAIVVTFITSPCTYCNFCVTVFPCHLVHVIIFCVRPICICFYRQAARRACRYCFYSRVEGLIFRFCPFIAAKLLAGAETHCAVKWWNGPPLPSCKIWWKSNNTRRCEATKCFLFLCHADAIRRCR